VPNALTERLSSRLPVTGRRSGRSTRPTVTVVLIGAETASILFRKRITVVHIGHLALCFEVLVIIRSDFFRLRNFWITCFAAAA